MKVLTRICYPIKKCMEMIACRYDFKIVVQEVDKDHIHLLIESIPRVAPAQIARVLKQESTFFMWKSHGRYLSKFYWGERTLWSDGYFVSSIGNVSEETVKSYIENQGR